MSKTQNSSLFNANDLFPSLREALAANNMNAGKLTVALPGTEQGRVLEIPERQNILLHDGEKTGHWKAPLLRELFRGDKKPPPNMSRYPEEYVPFFWFIERHLLTASSAEGGLRDRELEDIYTSLRRCP